MSRIADHGLIQVPNLDRQGAEVLATGPKFPT